MKFKIPLLMLRYALLFGLIFGFTAQSALAQGRMVIKPGIAVGFQSDSNFHKSETNEKQVYTYNIKPMIEFSYVMDKTRVSLNYFADILRYNDQDTIPAGGVKADDFDYVAHNAMFTAENQISDRFLIGVDNLYMKSSDPASADANSNGVERFKYSMNNFSPRLLYNFGDKFGIGLKYNNLKTDYSDDAVGQGEDSDENRGTGTFYYYFTPRTSFNLDYQVWTRDYDKATSDYNSQQVMVNVNHQVNFFTFTAGAGYHARNFDKAVSGGDLESFVWKLSVAGSDPDGAKSTMFMSIGSNYNDSGSGETYYKTTRFDAKLTYLVMEKINFTLAGSLQNSEYETSTREDDRWLVSLGADYLVNDFFNVGLEGGKEKRDSNFAGKDFDNDYIMVKAQFNYDLSAK
ncbi:outer membrane beta-barrel protein [Desulfobacula sp.]